ncbi:uncharacterized protein TDEL_0A00990 [Torulaspora delbrueckii]|uniref:Uncharacterized protein n=1 Tax=Torulaspora delbrueckii TaxID=4950 RepID=G8ZLD7_TORDE|nr:hypothetical protein TDEL_0A00990 [Torulaspora delbrueckii]CCE89431.1 hypothetical protein TDEL_0A00990 [Torulaspora delbrueckii]
MGLDVLNGTQIIVPCGTQFNLTLNATTTPLDGWLCGLGAKDNSAKDNFRSNTGQELNFTKISCGDGSYLQINSTTNVLDGYFCARSESKCYQAKNSASSKRVSWKPLLAIIVCLSLANI